MTTPPYCPDGRTCFVNVCGRGVPGCFRVRLESLEAVQASGKKARFDEATNRFVAVEDDAPSP